MALCARRATIESEPIYLDDGGIMANRDVAV